MRISYQDRRTFHKCLYSFVLVCISTVLSHLPVYGVNPLAVKSYFTSASILGFQDILTGGGLSQLAIGGFAVTSIIMSDIILQLLAMMFPKIEKVRSNGEVGRRLFQRLELILAVLMTLGVGISIAVTMSNSKLYELPYPWLSFISVIEWTVGSIIICSMAQLNEKRGIGNGPTLILAANIACRIPDTLSSFFLHQSDLTGIGVVSIAFFIVIILAVYLQEGTQRIKYQSTRKQRSVLNSFGEIIVPVSISSVLPIVYATSLMLLPSLAKYVWHNVDWLNLIASACTQYNWYNPTSPEHYVGLAVYIVMIFVFSIYAARMSFSGDEIAMRMRENGDVIPSVKPGNDTVKYLNKCRFKLSVMSAFFLLFIALIPDIVLARMELRSFSFMGTGLIILMAAFWDLRLRFTALTKHWNIKYRLIGSDKHGNKTVC